MAELPVRIVRHRAGQPLVRSPADRPGHHPQRGVVVRDLVRELVGHHAAHRVAEDESPIRIDRPPFDAELVELPLQHVLDRFDRGLDERDIAVHGQEVVAESNVPAAQRFPGGVRVVSEAVRIQDEEAILPIRFRRGVGHDRKGPGRRKVLRTLRAAVQGHHERETVPAVLGEYALVPVVPADRRIELELSNDALVDELVWHYSTPAFFIVAVVISSARRALSSGGMSAGMRPPIVSGATPPS